MPDRHVMMVDYTVQGNAFQAGKPNLWEDRQLAVGGGLSYIDLAPDGRRLAILAPETTDELKGNLDVTFLLNSFDELRRRSR